ncbi:MAG: hypothetical protein ACKOCI_11360 [Cyanobium sp.]
MLVDRNTQLAVVEGEVQEGRRYTEAEFNRIIEIERRERQRVEILLSQIDPRQKTLVFCASRPASTSTPVSAASSSCFSTSCCSTT